MPNFAIFLNEDVYKILVELCKQENKSKGKLISELVVKYGKEKGIYPTRT